MLARSLADAVSNWDCSLATLYSLPAIEFGTYVKANWDSVTIVDSPLQNLALFEALLASTNHNTVPLSGVSSNLIELSAIFIGTASDKTIPVTKDTVKALLTIAGYRLADGVVADIAAKAEQVRLDILGGLADPGHRWRQPRNEWVGRQHCPAQVGQIDVIRGASCPLEFQELTVQISA